jgi:putative hemolysin
MTEMNIEYTADVSQPRERYSVEVAHEAAAVRAAQKLRYEVFAEELQVNLNSKVEGIDEDEFDAVCDHLLVHDYEAGSVVGCYRILRPERAKHTGYYSASEFDLSGLASILPVTAEAGQACVHSDYRRGPILLMLWSAVARYLRDHQLKHIMGCVSISTRDGGHNASALTQSLMKRYASPYQATPLQPFHAAAIAPALRPSTPPLVKGYLQMGARICGAPAYDPLFECADFLSLISLEHLSARYLQHFFGKAAVDLAAHDKAPFEAVADRTRITHGLSLFCHPRVTQVSCAPPKFPRLK